MAHCVILIIIIKLFWKTNSLKNNKFKKLQKKSLPKKRFTLIVFLHSVNAARKGEEIRVPIIIFKQI